MEQQNKQKNYKEMQSTLDKLQVEVSKTKTVPEKLPFSKEEIAELSIYQQTQIDNIVNKEYEENP